MEDRDIHWSTALEELVAAEGERCRGLAWVHQRAEAHYAFRNNIIAIPVIVLSTLSGTASIGSSSLFGDSQYASLGIGSVSILVGILQTLSSYYSFSRKAESHRVAYLQYSKLFSVIRIELSLPRSERKSPQQLLQDLRDNMERLAETTPTPPQSILDDFNRHFRDEDKSIARPIEVNGLQKIIIQRVPSLEIKTPVNIDGNSETLWRDNPLTERTARKRTEHPNQIPSGETGSERNEEAK